jgi:serine/threonine kinase 38
VSKKNFTSLAVIGRGAFGEVRLCREIKSGKIVAIKSLKKKEMIKKNQQTHLRDERNVLADGS